MSIANRIFKSLSQFFQKRSAMERANRECLATQAWCEKFYSHLPDEHETISTIHDRLCFQLPELQSVDPHEELNRIVTDIDFDEIVIQLTDDTGIDFVNSGLIGDKSVTIDDFVMHAIKVLPKE